MADHYDWAAESFGLKVECVLIASSHSYPEKFPDSHHKVEYQADRLTGLLAYQE